ncbi:hypothetical protein PY257_07395 [Ramlibacter sp. H39-3-26]|uniref:hypothetical protein n=1 Tax=Curvibacter soli TaxID=3031331 RepID=UPI0023DADA7B|nr:hypothetical protein [Ramlibacter sp. H39-3-26]MDF1485008.1 hypothetical protein [Ramlibacter sp. H39-3-26]
MDYIKSERHREHFLSIAPECIIVDEAHTCASSGAGKQLRFELLQRLAKDAERHLLLLTATPHSGDEAAFYNRGTCRIRMNFLNAPTCAQNRLRPLPLR